MIFSRAAIPFVTRVDKLWTVVPIRVNAVAVRNTDLHIALRLNLVYTNSWVRISSRQTRNLK